MKKTNGFTLVEVLAVVVILGILSAIIVPNIFSSISKAKTKSYNILIENIKDNAKLYVLRHKEIFYSAIDATGYYEITLNDLYQDKLLKVPVIDPRTNTSIDLNKYIIVTTTSNNTRDGEIYCYEDEEGCVTP